MHVVLCLLVVVHCVYGKTEKNDFEKANFTVSEDVTPVEDEERSSIFTDVSSTLVATDGRRNTEESDTKNPTLSSSLSPTDRSSTSQAISSSNFFTSSPYTSTQFEFSTQASCDEIPEVDNLTTRQVNGFDVLLKWDPPINTNCVESYVVYWSNKRQNTTDTELLISDLNACQQYNISVAVFNGTNVGRRKSVTTSAFFYTIGPLEVTSYTKNLKVTWQQPPRRVLHCIKSYFVEWTYNEVTYTNETTAFYYNIPNIPCTKYTISIYAKRNNKWIAQSERRSYITQSVLPKIENVTITEVGSFNVSLQWSPLENNNCFRRYVVYLNDTEYEHTADTELTVTNLNACEQYRMGVRVFNGTHSGRINYDSVTTEAPSSFNYNVTQLKVEELGENLRISWKPPSFQVVKCVRSYYLQWDDGEDTTNETLEASQNTIQVPKIPCVQYEILVYPQTADAKGLPNHITYTTEKYPTNPPTIVENTSYKTEALIIWKIDDSSNKCELLQLVVTCHASGNLNDDLPWGKSVSMDINSTDVIMSIDGLSPFTKYTCFGVVKNVAGNSSSTKFRVYTEEDVPSEPTEIEVGDDDSHSFVVTWSKPKRIPGILTGYDVRIYNKGPAFHPPSRNCVYNTNNSTQFVDAFQNSYNFKQALPYYRYEIAVSGSSGAGSGDTATFEYESKTSRPDPVTKLELHPTSHLERFHLTFDPPCNLNGPFRFFNICINGERDDSLKDKWCNTTDQNFQSVILKPEYDYIIGVTVYNTNFSSLITTTKYQTPSGVPILGEKLKEPLSNETTKSYFKFSKDAFKDTNGRILYYALKLSSQTSQSKESSGSWNHIWPSDSITPARWNPFKNGSGEIVFVIGGNESCSEHYCNKPLAEDTAYTLIVRGFTRATYKDTAPLHFKTMKPSKTGLILGLLFGFLILLIVPIALFLWKRQNSLGVTGGKPLATIPGAVSCAKFPSFYETVTENPSILKSQFAALSSQSKEVAGATSFGVLPENKRKNRYTNILPYDHTRVKLQIDEDDEISSDYINASYIKGYSGKIEYIATQGPLESTSKDFWKMIIQENVTMIVMVSQFVEQSKEKCFQYFPNNHEKVSFGESLDVRCSTELHFGTYCIRTLQVRKDTEQRNVIHLQYLEWPDFGVPQSTDNVLQLCHQMRDKASTDGGVIVVHCSAGVGRTGTLIALDILLQIIQRQKNLNVYKTVFELRKQRTNMVQTEKQYVFLHTCIRDYLQSPTIGQSNDQVLDHTYENMDILRSSLTKNLLEIESESVL